MNLKYTVTQNELLQLLHDVGTKRPVFIWSPPGTGKSALVQRFAAERGMACISLLGSRFSSDEIPGDSSEVGGISRNILLEMAARTDPYVLFLDELNISSREAQKRIYSLVHERVLDGIALPEGSIIIGAGNAPADDGTDRELYPALINIMFHVCLRASPDEWLEWAASAGVHKCVMGYIRQNPDHLFSPIPQTAEPYSTPRSWHMLSDVLNEYSAEKKGLPENLLRALVYGAVSADHAKNFLEYISRNDTKNLLNRIIMGEEHFPTAPEDKERLEAVANCFKAVMLDKLPAEKSMLDDNTMSFAERAKEMITELTAVNLDLAQSVVSPSGTKALPEWFMIDVVHEMLNVSQGQ